MEELRSIAGYAVSCAEPVLVLYERAEPDDPRPAAALDAARVFAAGAPRSRLQRTAATDAHRAAKEASTEPARHAATAAGDAAAAAYHHPLATATQVRHILGAATHAARAAELARGDDPVVAEYILHPPLPSEPPPVVLDVLGRYPRAPHGRNLIAALMAPARQSAPRPAADARGRRRPGPVLPRDEGRRGGPGELLTPGWRSNYGSGHQGQAHLPHGQPRGRAAGRPARPRGRASRGSIGSSRSARSRTIPTSPTSASPATRPRSYRTTEPLRVVEEVEGWEPPPRELVEHLREPPGRAGRARHRGHGRLGTDRGRAESGTVDRALGCLAGGAPRSAATTPDATCSCARPRPLVASPNADMPSCRRAPSTDPSTCAS